MSRFLQALQDHYPDLVREMDAVDAMVGNRPIDVLDLMAATSDEAERVRATLGGGFEDARDAIFDLLDAGPSADHEHRLRLGASLMIALYRAYEVGLWTGQQRLASLKPRDLTARLRQIERTLTTGEP